MYFPTLCGTSGYFYEAFQLTAVNTGYYKLSSNSSIGIHYFIYKNTFDPLDLANNLLLEKGDEQDFRLSLFLQDDMMYVLVVTSFTSNQTGAFSIVADGPPNITVRRTSEYHSCESVFFFLIMESKVHSFPFVRF